MAGEKFQSTHPRGVRPMADQKSFQPFHFNPRTRVGCDAKRMRDDVGKKFHFNPRTRVGCDITNQFPLIAFIDFNPRTRVGCD